MEGRGKGGGSGEGEGDSRPGYFHHLLPIKGVKQTVSNSDRELEVPRECLPVYNVAPGSSSLPVQLLETRRDLSQLDRGELRDRLGVSALEGGLALAHILLDPKFD